MVEPTQPDKRYVGDPAPAALPTGTPAWIADAVVYGVIPRSFGEAGFRSVTARLDDLRDLGINAIWLAPTNQCPPGDYGYAVTDYFKLRTDSGGGTEPEFRALVREAHDRGIRVLMDFVPNHTSAQHPYFLDARARGRESPYYDYYDRDESGLHTHYFNWDQLPNLNYDHPEVERWMTEAFAYWVREFDVDGFRVDAAWGLRARKPEYWPRCCAALRWIKPDLLLLAETPGRDPYYFASGFDAAYDWALGYGAEYDWWDDLGKWAWDGVFDDDAELTDRLHRALTNDGRGYAPDALLFRFLNNNDTGERFVTRYGEGKTRVATALLLTLPGIPCVYTGDEVGAEFTPYGEPGPIDWTDRRGMRPYHKQLIALRSRTPSLRSRSWLPVPVEPADAIYAYLRYGEPDRKPALVVLNWRAEEVRPTVRVPDRFRVLSEGGELRDLLSGDRVMTSGGDRLGVPMRGHSARVLVAETNR